MLQGLDRKNLYSAQPAAVVAVGYQEWNTKSDDPGFFGLGETWSGALKLNSTLEFRGRYDSILKGLTETSNSGGRGSTYDSQYWINTGAWGRRSLVRLLCSHVRQTEVYDIGRVDTMYLQQCSQAGFKFL